MADEDIQPPLEEFNGEEEIAGVEDAQLPAFETSDPTGPAIRSDGPEEKQTRYPFPIVGIGGSAGCRASDRVCCLAAFSF
jgi:hypothetical protein